MSDKMREALEACPFCGGENLTMYSHPPGEMYWVACADCGLEAPTETGVTAEKALKYWNTRADQAPSSRPATDGAVRDADIVTGAMAIAISRGHNPDDPAPLTEMCTEDNAPVPWWKVFTEEAEACLKAVILAAPPAAAGREEIIDLFYKHIWHAEPADMRKAIESAADAILALGPTIPPQDGGADDQSAPCCPFCKRDPFHYADNGVGMEAVAVTCCDLGDLYFRGARPAPEDVPLSWEEFCDIGRRLALRSTVSPQVLCADAIDSIAKTIWLAEFGRAFSRTPSDPWENQADPIKEGHRNTARKLIEAGFVSAPPAPMADRAAVIEECAKILDEAAKDWRRIRDPGMANNAAAYAKKIRALSLPRAQCAPATPSAPGASAPAQPLPEQNPSGPRPPGERP